MKPTHEQVSLINALKAIYAECCVHDDCEDCPLFVEDTCGIVTNTPNRWLLNSKGWCAFTGVVDKLDDENFRKNINGGK